MAPRPGVRGQIHTDHGTPHRPRNDRTVGFVDAPEAQEQGGTDAEVCPTA
jgi:hypothetical protein